MAKCSIIDGLRGWASRTSTNPEMTDAILKAANEIERLRAELKESYGDWATDDTAIREAAGRVLPDLAINGDTWHVPHMTDVCELLVAEVERLREERRWRSTKTELPPEKTNVICAYAGSQPYCGCREGSDWFEENGFYLASPPTHWQPLPAPPVEEE